VHDDVAYFPQLRDQLFAAGTFSPEETALAFRQVRSSVSKILTTLDEGSESWSGLHSGLSRFVSFNNDNTPLFLYPVENDLFLIECLRTCFALSQPAFSVDFDNAFYFAMRNAIFSVHGHNNVLTLADLSKSKRWQRLPVQDAFVIGHVDVIQERSMRLRSVICK
jgi:hypothetical protein